MEHINPGVTIVTTMAYDMATEHDNNISTEIKGILTGTLGWRGSSGTGTVDLLSI